MRQETDAAIEAELTQLASMAIAGLRAKYRATFDAEPPKAFGPDLLRRSIAHRLQERAYGGLDKATAKLLQQLMLQSAKTPGRLVLPRRIKPGATLVRRYKGRSHRVTVLEEGFGYEGETYESLSQIARKITGTRWNGPRFFGLRASKEGAT